MEWISRSYQRRIHPITLPEECRIYGIATTCLAGRVLVLPKSRGAFDFERCCGTDAGLEPASSGAMPELYREEHYCPIELIHSQGPTGVEDPANPRAEAPWQLPDSNQDLPQFIEGALPLELNLPFEDRVPHAH